MHLSLIDFHLEFKVVKDFQKKPGILQSLDFVDKNISETSVLGIDELKKISILIKIGQKIKIIKVKIKNSVCRDTLLEE